MQRKEAVGTESLEEEPDHANDAVIMMTVFL
jgi:hypothetical protein